MTFLPSVQNTKGTNSDLNVHRLQVQKLSVLKLKTMTMALSTRLGHLITDPTLSRSRAESGAEKLFGATMINTIGGKGVVVTRELVLSRHLLLSS